MRRMILWSIAAAISCSRAPSTPAPRSPRSPEELKAARIRALVEPLRPLQEPTPVPGRLDWLAVHDEPGQTFEQYLGSGPVLPDATRKILYVQPLGKFTRGQRALVEKAADFLGRAYALEVRIRPDKPVDDIPPLYHRDYPPGNDQLLTKYLLEIVLKRDLPDDAVAMIAFTAKDLWPGAGWNFVYGQATLQDRVGVWSLARLGDPDGTPDDFVVALRRTLKIAAHETGHMFSFKHCTAHRCLMAGNNGQDELDRTPLRYCPEELAKLLWATGGDPAARLRGLAEFCAREGLRDEAVDFLRASKAVETNVNTPAGGG